ncbi:MAG TPA: hypothetical protein VFI25_15945 [Planctomycetota bacterium]|jgi:hypothetical protein|nr:hypothetical protein [Planctomycetota bacterium]
MSGLPDEITVREYRPGDEGSIVECFNRVFAAGNPSFVPRTLEAWRWEFERNPAGRRIALAVRGSGDVVAQFCALPARALFEGRGVTFHQAVDSMADPRHGRSLFPREGREKGRRPTSLFVRTAEFFVERWGLSGSDLFGYGFPIPIAHRIGREHLGYEVIRTQLLLWRPVEGATPGRSPSPPGAGVVLEEPDRLDARVDALWERCAGAFRASLVRDLPYLRWRYEENRSFRYRWAVVRAAGGEALLGLAAYRRGTFSDRDQGLLVEWLVPRAEPEAARALLGWAIRRAGEEGADRLAAVLPDSSPWFLFFQREGFLVERTKYVLVGRNYIGREDAGWFRKHWEYTLGDFDLA